MLLNERTVGEKKNVKTEPTVSRSLKKISRAHNMYYS